MKYVLAVCAVLLILEARANETGLFGVTHRNAARMKDTDLSASVEQMTIVAAGSSIERVVAPCQVKKERYGAKNSKGHILSESGFGSHNIIAATYETETKSG
jgi:hypothetical protein